MKHCTICLKIKPLKEFSLDKRIKGKHQSRCKECAALWARLYRKTGINPIRTKRTMPKGIKSHRWNGGRWIIKQGYVMVNINGEQILEHRHIFEQSLGRKLTKLEHIHHIDGDKTNNKIENLELMTNSEHVTRHLISQWKNGVRK